MKPCSKHIDSTSSATWLKQAERMARSLRGRFQSNTQWLDGFKVTGSVCGGNLRASVMDIPGRILSFGENVIGQPGLFMEYEGPIRDRFAPADPVGVLALSQQQQQVDVGSMRAIGAPLTGTSFVASARPHEYVGGIVLPFIMAEAAVPRSGLYPNWSGIPASNTLWLVFRFTFAGAKALPVRSVSIDDATIRSLAPGYDLVRRDIDVTSALTRGTSPFPECYVHDDSLYVAVAVQKPGDGDGRCIGALLILRIDYDDTTESAAVGFFRLVEPEDFGEPLFELDPNTSEKGGANISGLALAVEATDPPRITVTGRLRNTLHTAPAVSPVRRWVLSARVKVEIAGAAVNLSYGYVDTLAGAAAGVPAGAISDPATVLMRHSTPDVLLPTPDGLLEHISLVTGARASGSETDNAAVVSSSIQQMVTLHDGAEVVQTASGLGWRTVFVLAGQSYYGEWLSGTTTQVARQAYPVSQDQALHLFLPLSDNSPRPIGMLSAAGLSIPAPAAAETIVLQVGVYQREVRDDQGEVVTPWAAYISGFDGAQAYGAVMAGSVSTPEFVPAPSFGAQGSFYIGNPLAGYQPGYGRMYG